MYIVATTVKGAVEISSPEVRPISELWVNKKEAPDPAHLDVLLL